jgi:two-component system, NarL family, sensor histidine kinase DevS
MQFLVQIIRINSSSAGGVLCILVNLVQLSRGEDFMVVLTREQIEERLAALHRASLELVGDLSLEVVLERIVNLARDQANARYAALGVLDKQGKLSKFIPVGMSDEEISLMDHPPMGLGLIGAIQHEGRTIRVRHISQDPRSIGFPSNHPPMESFLGVPILLGERLLGQIYLTDKMTHPEFTPDDERVIEMLAAYAAVAINNAELYENLLARDHDLVQRNADLALLNDLAVNLARTSDVQEVLQITLERVMAYLDVEVEAGEIFLKEEESPELRLALHLGESAEPFWTLDHFLPEDGLIGKVAKSGMAEVVQIGQRELRYIRRSVGENSMRCIACIPLIARRDVVGVMGVLTRNDQVLDSREMNLLNAVGALAGVTIDNARLNRQAQRLAVLEERERIGMDLHDGTIQSIYAVGLALEYALVSLVEEPAQARQKIIQATEGLNTTIRDIRAYILDLRPRSFKGEDLLESLKRLVDEFHENTRTEVILTGSENGKIALPPDQADALFHICQEALANVAKHARANKVTIQLWKAPERVLMEISDNGNGFDLRRMEMKLGHGLSNMQTRARRVSGDVEITSEAGKGTTVLAWVPVRRSNEAYKPQ